MQFCWNLQLLTHFSLFRNLPWSNTNFWWLILIRFLCIQYLWCFLNYSSWYFKYLLTRYSILLVFFTKLSFILFMVKCFISLIHFIVGEHYEFPKSTIHILSVPLNLECVRILSWSISFFSYFNCLPDDVLCKIAIWADDNALNLSCYKPFDLSLQAVILC